MLPIFAKNLKLEKSVRLASTSDLLTRNESKRLLSQFPEIIYSKLSKNVTQDVISKLLLAKECDIIMTPFARLPKKLPDGAVLAGVSERSDSKLVFIGREDVLNGPTLRDIKEGTQVITRSSIVSLQLQSLLENVECIESRLRVDQLLGDVRKKKIDACILYAFELEEENLNLDGFYRWDFSPYELIAQAGTGVVTFMCRMDDIIVRQFIKQFHTSASSICTNVERKISKAFDNENIAAFCHIDERGNYRTFVAYEKEDGCLIRENLAMPTTSGLADKLIEQIKSTENVSNI